MVADLGYHTAPNLVRNLLAISQFKTCQDALCRMGWSTTLLLSASSNAPFDLIDGGV